MPWPRDLPWSWLLVRTAPRGAAGLRTLLRRSGEWRRRPEVERSELQVAGLTRFVPMEARLRQLAMARRRRAKLCRVEA
jgi:hypothetical protein